MSHMFNELDCRPTPIRAPGLGIRETMPAQEFPMTRLFTSSEAALGRRGVAARAGDGLDGDALDIAAGGPGHGHTAEKKVRNLLEVKHLGPAIDWHATGTRSLGTTLDADPRRQPAEDDFLAMAPSDVSDNRPGRRFDAILADIDNSRDRLLEQRGDCFHRIVESHPPRRSIQPGGIFGPWSKKAADRSFPERLIAAFAEAHAKPVTFEGHLTGKPCTRTACSARAEPN